jgi:hypothetical protein
MYLTNKPLLPPQPAEGGKKEQQETRWKRKSREI